MAERIVLCVDDEPNVLSALSRLLRKEDFRFLSAPDGAQGLEVLAREPVQVVIADQRMPGMSGVEFLKKVKERHPDTVRVVLSGTADVNVVLESINQGEIYRFVTKPWNDDELKVIIRQCLAQHELIVQNRNLVDLVRAQIRELQRVNTRLEAEVAKQTRSLRSSRAILQRLPLPVIGVTRAGRLIACNEVARATFSVLRDLRAGAEVGGLLPAPLQAVFDRFWQEGKGTYKETVEMDGRPVRVHVLSPEDTDIPDGCVIVLE